MSNSFHSATSPQARYKVQIDWTCGGITYWNEGVIVTNQPGK
jgi:hypothetical protein